MPSDDSFVINEEDFNMEIDHLLPEGGMSEPAKPQGIPLLTRGNPGFGTSIALDNPRLLLNPIYNSNGVTNDLFQITNQKHKNHDLFGMDEDDYDDNINNDVYENGQFRDSPDIYGDYDNKRLNNDKIDKLMKTLENSNSSLTNEMDFEMDDQGRTRIFKGRFNKTNFDNDDLDSRLSAYLNSPDVVSDNKENVTIYSDPVKPGIRHKEGGGHNQRIKKPALSKKTNLNGATPILKPLNVDLKKHYHNDISKRVCKPNHRIQINAKPNIIYKTDDVNIYLVDSLTGSLTDATQFGTELNASNCEGFPLPEDVNEVVQIPTNEETTVQKKVQHKMAIIKGFQIKYWNNNLLSTNNTSRTGFYSKSEFDNYTKNIHISQQSDSGVEVTGQTPPGFTTSQGAKKSRVKSVKWPDDSELSW